MAANDYKYATTPIGTDIPCKNTEASTALAAGNVVKLDATNVLSGTQANIGVLQGAATTDYPVGVAMEAAAAGKQLRVRCEGIAQVVAGAAITAGALVMPTTAGKVITQTAAKPQLGQALTAAAADGDRILVLLSRALNA